MRVAEGLKSWNPRAWQESVNFAVDREYIGLNSDSYLNAIVIDCDHDDVEKWSDLHLPRPTWITITPVTQRHHLVWLLKSPINKARPKAVAFFNRVRAALDHALKGDGAYNGYLTKNPFHPTKWHTQYWAGEPIELWALYEPIAETVPTYIPRKGRKKREVRGLGRHCDHFDELRFWAYDNVANMSPGAFIAAVHEKAAELNTFAEPLLASEVRSNAKSVANYTLNVYKARCHDENINRGAMGLSNLDLPTVTKQQMSAKRSSVLNRRKSDLVIEKAIGRLKSDNKQVTQKAVAELSGKSLSTIKRRWVNCMGWLD